MIMFAELLAVWADEQGLRHPQSAGARDRGKLHHSNMAKRLSFGDQKYDPGAVRRWLKGGVPQESPAYFAERMGLPEPDVAAAISESRYQARRPVNLDEHTEAVILTEQLAALLAAISRNTEATEANTSQLVQLVAAVSATVKKSSRG
jgi:hypothetical protein